jgi:hypothetical protein
MKHQIRITLFAVACLVSEVHAQDTHNPPDVNLERARQILTMARRDVFQHAMALNDPQKEAFWNTYADYDKQRALLTDQATQLLREYATEFDTLTNEQAVKMMSEAADMSRKQIDLRRKCADQISKKLGGRVGARFYQLDDYMDTVLKLDLLDDVPVVPDPH